MQTIAREMNFSESTFIFPAEGEGRTRGRPGEMRIFTPGAELPMAGHPTIGSTFALAHEGTIAAGQTDFVFELGVGPTPVSLEWAGRCAVVRVDDAAAAVVRRDRAGSRAWAAAIGIEERELAPDLPLQVVSCGVPFMFVPIASRAAVDRVAIDRTALTRCYAQAGIEELPTFFFTMDGAGENGSSAQTVYSRMLAPGFGITEDPATGGASGPLGCYLVHYDIVPSEAARDIVSLQGVAMGRPSRIHISIDARDGGITRVRVGGRSVLVGHGELYL